MEGVTEQASLLPQQYPFSVHITDFCMWGWIIAGFMEYYDLPFVQGGSREHLLSAVEINTYK